MELSWSGRVGCLVSAVLTGVSGAGRSGLRTLIPGTQGDNNLMIGATAAVVQPVGVCNLDIDTFDSLTVCFSVFYLRHGHMCVFEVFPIPRSFFSIHHPLVAKVQESFKSLRHYYIGVFTQNAQTRN